MHYNFHIQLEQFDMLALDSIFRVTKKKTLSNMYNLLEW